MPTPSDLLWLLLGAAGAGAVTAVAAALRRGPARGAALPAPGPTRPQPDDGADALLVGSIAEELATLLSGVEARAHTLIDRAPHRDELPTAAAALLEAIGQMRRLHRKLAAFAAPPPRGAGATDLSELVPTLGDELQHLLLGLEVRWRPAANLPPVALPAAVLREALLYTGRALLRAEPGARRLSIDAELALAGDTPVVQLGMMLEWDGDPTGPACPLGTDAAGRLAQAAALNLLAAHGGDLLLTHRPGHAAEALLVLPLPAPEPAAAEAAGADPSASVPPTTHRDHAAALPPTAAARAAQPAAPTEVPLHHAYGGVLVLESDPTVRAMLATELRAAHRAVFACADPAAASALLAATPERFEMLVVDQGSRLTDLVLADAVRTHAPQLVVCVLAPRREAPPGWPHLHHIPKPFDRHELRIALAAALARG